MSVVFNVVFDLGAVPVVETWTKLVTRCANACVQVFVFVAL